MSQPKYVPVDPVADSHYESPPRRDRQWTASRPGDVVTTGQPSGELLGSQGPDQGYALKLARHFEPQLFLADGEDVADVHAGCVAVALKRASSFHRAPTSHDMRCAYSIFGYMDSSPDPGLIELRQAMFAEVAHPHHYAERRAIVDAIPTEFLHRPHDQVLADCANWRDVLGHITVH